MTHFHPPERKTEWSYCRSRRDDSNATSYASQLLLVFEKSVCETIFREISEIFEGRNSVFSPNSARSGPIDLKPPPFDLLWFMLIYKNGWVVVGVVVGPLDSKTSLFSLEKSRIEEFEKRIFEYNSARRGASNLKPPPIDIWWFILIFRVGLVVSGVGVGPTDFKKRDF